MPKLLKKGNRSLQPSRVVDWIIDNVVTLLFIAFTILGFIFSRGVTPNYFLNELSARFFRNAFLILSLIIPVVAGLGLNFGIVVGAMAAQIAILIVRYMMYDYDIGSIGGLLLTALIALPLAVLFGYLTGRLYNKTKGQEMIASLIVGYFANGVYMFLLLYVVGAIIPVAANSPLIMPNGIGVRMSVDLVPVENGGLTYALDNIWKVPFTVGMIVISVCLLAYLAYQYFRRRQKRTLSLFSQILYGVVGVFCLVVIGICIHAQVAETNLTKVNEIPAATGLAIIALCMVNHFLMRTKLGQDFRSVGQSQQIAQTSGINVNRTRIIATILSTVFAAWGQIIYVQNMGTFAPYDTHRNIGMFSVAALLVGGASTSKATVQHAMIGTLLFNAMFIMSSEVGGAVLGNSLLNEYFRTFMVYGVIGIALGLYVWKNNKKSQLTVD